MSILGDLIVNIKANATPYLQSVNSAQAALKNFSTSVKKTATNISNDSEKMGKSVQNSFKQSGKSMKDIMRIAQGITVSQAFYKITSSIKEASSALGSFTMNAEEAQVAFGLMFKDENKAERFMTMLEDFAADTPYTLEQAAMNARKLLAYGFDPKVIGTLSNVLSDTAAAAGDPEAYNRVGKAIGQIRTKGKLASQELLQLTEAGIPAFEILREKLKLTADQMGKIGDLAIPADIAINALLKGMQERYGGAAQAISETTKGMISTIKDNMLIIGRNAFEPFISSFKGVVRTFRDESDRMREIARTGGFNAVIRDLIPARIFPQIQLLVANLKSLWQAVKLLFASWVPIWQAIGRIVLGVLNALLPVITTIVNALGWLTYSFTNSTPRVKAFVAALLGLLAASAVTWVLLNLITVLKKLFIVKALIFLVTGLAKAFRFLALAMISNPWIALLGVAAGALLYFGATSQKVSGWLTGLGEKFNKVFGNDPSKIFTPKMKENNTQADEFNQNLSVSNESLDKFGKNAKKAGKAAKDMLASFDEVFTITQKIDEDAGIDAGDIEDITTPTIPPVQIPEPEFPDTDSSIQGWVNQFADSLKTKLKNALIGAGIGALIGAILGGLIGGPEGALIGAGLGALAGGIAGWFWDQLPEDFKNAFKGAGIGAIIGGLIGGLLGGPAGAVLGAGLGALAGGIAGYFWDRMPENFKTAFKGAGIGAVIGGVIGAMLGGPAGAVIGAGIGALAGGIVGFFWDDIIAFLSADTTVGVGIGGAIGGAIGAILGGPGGAVIGTAIGALAGGIVGFFWDDLTALFSTDSGQGAAIGAAIGAVLGGPVGAAIGGLLGANYQSITAWIADTASLFGNWVSDTSAQFVDWAGQTGASIGSWADKSLSDLGAWVDSASASFVDWVGQTGASLGSWADETLGILSSWDDNTSQDFQTWATDTLKGFKDWVSNSSAGFTDWVGETGANFGAWADNVLASIEAWSADTMNSFKQWKEATSEGFSSWWEATKTGFTDWASGIADKVTYYFDLISAKLQNAKEAMKFWKDDKNYIDTSKIPSGGWDRSGSRASLAGHARGGVFNREHVARFAEGNKPEAIIPLQNDTAMQPFVDAVASGIQQSLSTTLARIPTTTPGTSAEDTKTPVYVGTLIADDRGLKELERRMRVIRIQEDQRRGTI